MTEKRDQNEIRYGRAGRFTVVDLALVQLRGVEDVLAAQDHLQVAAGLLNAAGHVQSGEILRA